MLKRFLRFFRSVEHSKGAKGSESFVVTKPTFTVISAVYNVNRYLDDYFSSLVAQEGFGDDIELILVDDGSTDDTAEIIREWQEKFPNIRYFYKENGGQASARNLGISEAKGDWLTFIDPDDYVSKDYFSEVRRTIQGKLTNIAIISTRLVLFHEATGKIAVNHPLDYRYRSRPIEVKSISNMGKHLQMSASHAFFRRSNIDVFQIRFDERVKPNFEDAKFTCEYLLHARGNLAVFLAKPQYIYRKRMDASSTLDLSGTDPRLFSDVIEFGMLELLEKAFALQGFAPDWLQRSCLYSIMWTIRALYNKRYQLSPELEQIFDELKDRLFAYIDETIISEFELAFIREYDKIALLGRHKQSNLNRLGAIFQQVEPHSNVASVLFWHSKPTCDFQLIHNDKRLVPIESKVTQIDLVGRPYVYASRVWFELPETGRLNAIYPSVANCVLGARAERWDSDAPSKKILNALRSFTIDDTDFPKDERRHRVRANLPRFQKYKNSWVFMDREHLADDNAEHLCRYAMLNHPELECHFVLSEESPHWERLSNDGFKLIPSGSEDHKMALTHCAYFLSSHIDKFIMDYPPRQYHADFLKDRKFVFLQHGVTKDDMSKWFNDKVFTHTIVTTTPEEHKSIISDFSPYIFSERQVQMVGMPRHDALLRRKPKQVDRLLFAPTWRPYLADVARLREGDHAPIEEFLDSTFYSEWNKVLSSQSLSGLIANTSTRLTLMLHPALEPFIDTFELPDWIDNLRYSEVDIQQILAETLVVVTDYSSVSFDAAILEKSLIYFQFDKEEFYERGNWQDGYFDYDRDGFGPVAIDHEKCLNEIKAALRRNGAPEQVYIDRIANTFPFRDGKNCERLMSHLLQSP